MTKDNHPDIRRTLLLIKRGDEVLLAMKKRGLGSGRWHAVGGKIETGETIEQALVRECREEIGVIPMNYWQVAEHDFIQDAETDNPWHLYAYVYMCDEWERDPEETEEMSPKWFKIQDIPYSDMLDDNEFWLPQVLAGDKVTGMFTFDAEDKLISHRVVVQNVLPNEAKNTD